MSSSFSYFLGFIIGIITYHLIMTLHNNHYEIICKNNIEAAESEAITNKSRLKILPDTDVRLPANNDININEFIYLVYESHNITGINNKIDFED